MNIYESDIWLSDIDEVLSELPELKELESKTIMITGATGLICSSVVDILIRYNETHVNAINILVAGRSREKTEARFAQYFNKDYFRFITYDASKADNEFCIPCNYIIHGASNAFPGNIVKEPVETMLSNFTGMKCLLDYAKAYGVRRLLFISSSEIYGKKKECRPYREDEYGYIDLLNPRNSYSIGKRAAETLCVSYADEYGVESVLARPGHIYGPTASPFDNRVSSAWAYAVARGENIVMRSDGLQLRSYCYCLDCASALLKVLLRGMNIHAYNISNPESIISIKEMAEFLVKSAGVKLIREEANEEERKGFNPMSNSSLDSSSLQELGWSGLFSQERGLAHTVSVLKEII